MPRATGIELRDLRMLGEIDDLSSQSSSPRRTSRRRRRAHSHVDARSGSARRRFGTSDGRRNINQRRAAGLRNEEFVVKERRLTLLRREGREPVHAIFGNDGRAHRASVEPRRALLAYGAKFRVSGPNGDREIAAADYFTMPTLQNVMKENVLADDELLTHVILRRPATSRAGTTKSATSVARLAARVCHVVCSDERFDHPLARVVLGAVAPVRGGRARPKRRSSASPQRGDGRRGGRSGDPEAKPMTATPTNSDHENRVKRAI